MSSNPDNSHVDNHTTRKVSSTGYDNHAFDTPRNRKISAISDHAEIGPVRKKSILHHSQPTDYNNHMPSKL